MTGSMFNLEGQAVLVTGGAGGIGLAIAELALALGARVAVCDLDGAAAGAWAAGQPAGRALGLACDVTRETDCVAVVARTLEAFGRLDVLVNNAGVIERPGGLASQTLSAWRQVIDVNLQGVFCMAQAAAAARRAKGRGAIVNMASVGGLTAFPGSNAYGVSKAAVAMLTKTLATELSAHGIRVNAVAPGFIGTAMTDGLVGGSDARRAAIQRRIPLGRFGEPEEVARLVLFLASDWAAYITGAVVPIDGGWTAFGGVGDASRPPA